MKRKCSAVLLSVGSLFVLGALLLFWFNQREAAAAEHTADKVLPQLQVQTEANQKKQQAQTEPTAAADDWNALLGEMDTVWVEGQEYIGTLQVPSVGLELPILADWSMDKLKIAPCRYAGTADGTGFVLMGHNYARGFGRLAKIAVGDVVHFRDVNGKITTYEVIGMDVLQPTAVEEMVSEAYDLSLFTCTYGGKARLTVRCEKREG